MAFMMPVMKSNYEIVAPHPKKSAPLGTKPKSHSLALPKTRPSLDRQYSKSFSAMTTVAPTGLVQAREMSDLNSERLAELRRQAKLDGPSTSTGKPSEVSPNAMVDNGKASNFWTLKVFRKRSVSSKTVR